MMLIMRFLSVIWTPLGKYGLFEIGYASFKVRFLWGVEVLVPVPGSAPAGSSPSLLLRLGFVLHGDALTLLHNIFYKTAFP